MKKLVYLALIPFVAMMLIAAFSSFVKAETATIWTDKADYAPGETVTIFGNGFNTLTNVSIIIERPDETNDTISAVTDDVGNFACTYQLDGVEGTYTVTATDGTNTSTTTFTDAALLPLWADAGSYVGGPNADKWIETSWVVSDAVPPGGSTSFNLYIDAVTSLPGGGPTYNVYLSIAVNDTAQIASITVGSTTITTFTYGAPTFPPAAGGGIISRHGIYPTWYALAAFGDVASNYGQYTAPYGSYWAYRANISVTITTSSAMNAGFKVHFDAQGVLADGSINITPFSRDLTFTGALSPQFYLTVISPYETPSGEGWYYAGSHAYATLGSDIVSYEPGVQYVFTEWSDDASGNGLTSDAILMNGPKTASANWKTQNYLTVDTSPSGSATPSGAGWYDAGTLASISTDEYVDLVPGSSRYRFDEWTTADPTKITDPSMPSTTVLMDSAKTVTANYATQYLVTFVQTGLDDSAAGTVVTTIIGDGPLLSKDYGNLPFSIWVDPGTSISYAYTNPVLSSTLGEQSWLSSITGPESSFTVTSSVTITGSYLLLPHSQVTTSKLSYFDTDLSTTGQQFRLIFTQNVSDPSTYNLRASNPGQFYYNVFYIGAPESTVALTITLPNRFVTQGTVPIHVYGNVDIVGGCFVPSEELSGFSISGTSTITVSGQVPGSGLVYVTVHLDYDLKGTSDYKKNRYDDALVGGTVVIPNLDLYTFSVSGAVSDSQTIQNENVFKRDPGFAGLVSDSQGTPIEGVSVQIYDPKGELLATVYTDEDGSYSYAYKYKGKPATFTVNLPDYIALSVTVRANSLMEVNFQI